MEARVSKFVLGLALCTLTLAGCCRGGDGRGTRRQLRHPLHDRAEWHRARNAGLPPPIRHRRRAQSRDAGRWHATRRVLLERDRHLLKSADQPRHCRRDGTGSGEAGRLLLRCEQLNHPVRLRDDGWHARHLHGERPGRTGRSHHRRRRPGGHLRVSSVGAHPDRRLRRLDSRAALLIDGGASQRPWACAPPSNRGIPPVPRHGGGRPHPIR